MFRQLKKANDKSAMNRDSVSLELQKTPLLQTLKEIDIGVDLFRIYTENIIRQQILLSDPRAFFKNAENTNRLEVTITINASINRLKARYSEINIDETLEEIEKYLTNNQPADEKKELVIACFKQIKQDPTKHVLSDSTLSHVLAYIWIGLHDELALVEGLDCLTENDIQDRRHLLRNQLYRTQTEYGIGQDNNACFGGTYNTLVETLDRIHPDVLIATGNDNILPAATERAFAIIRDELKKKSEDTQRLILKLWYDSDAAASQTIATRFRDEMAVIVNDRLENEFQQLLTKEKREEITSQFEYLPHPEAIIAEINKLPDDDSKDYRQAIIKDLKNQTKQIYDDLSLPLSEIKKKLQKSFNDFKLCENQKFKPSLAFFNDFQPEISNNINEDKQPG